MRGEELVEKLGGNDPCPCGSGRRFPPMLPPRWPLRRHQRPPLRPRLNDRDTRTTAPATEQPRNTSTACATE
ncbi:SEC-C metal-binding domain-containing protein [Paractinoplanes toevensis]|uniref:SEC-C metal-binding domain-containing protein n=1 Tax=Paractinoplanes toevensis TaxID=571911 RepID=UPI001BB32B32